MTTLWKIVKHRQKKDSIRTYFGLIMKRRYSPKFDFQLNKMTIKIWKTFHVLLQTLFILEIQQLCSTSVVILQQAQPSLLSDIFFCRKLVKRPTSYIQYWWNQGQGGNHPYILTAQCTISLLSIFHFRYLPSKMIK